MFTRIVTHLLTLEKTFYKEELNIQDLEDKEWKEHIYEMQKRFTHIVNHQLALGKTFDKEELNIKILKSLNRTWITLLKHLIKKTQQITFIQNPTYNNQIDQT